MKHSTVLLLQLPIPQLNFGRQTFNIPLGAACLKQVCADFQNVHVEILSESVSSYLADEALLQYILSKKPDIIGFTVCCWNVQRTLYLASKIKTAYDPKIVFGGPEITPDNPLIDGGAVDFYVYGEGEAVWKQLLQDGTLWRRKSAAIPAGDLFRTSLSPYIAGLLEPEIENTMLLETQRGCPYRCAYCYYNKTLARVALAERNHLLQAVKWARDHQIKELFLLDPSLNARPDLIELLKAIGYINADKRLAILSEIRADTIDENHAALFASAGFTWFEIGLQTTNKEALAVMKRPTNLKHFLKGAKLLKRQGIKMCVDLIAGLPGDNLSGFKATVDFVAQNDLHHDVQIFPLSVLPGTDFRKHHQHLGLKFDSSPPYLISETAGFSSDDISEGLDYAEKIFDVAFYPLPDLDVSWRSQTDIAVSGSPDCQVHIGQQTFISKLVLDSPRSFQALQKVAARLTHPYQIFIGRAVNDINYLLNMLEILSTTNPFTPFEVVFLEPEVLPDTATLLSAIKIHRPHYLDNDLKFAFSKPGNRAVIFTLVTRQRARRFSGDMKRQIYWWQAPDLPEMETLRSLNELDGILIDSHLADHKLISWQDRFAQDAGDMIMVSFSEVSLQRRWLNLTAADDYYFGEKNLYD